MRNVLAILAAILLLASCHSVGKQSGKLTAAKGGRFYGGVLKMNEVEYFRSLYPLNINEGGRHRITNQIYEGLVRFDQGDLSIKPCLADRWEMSPDGMTYTFFL